MAGGMFNKDIRQEKRQLTMKWKVKTCLSLAKESETKGDEKLR